MAYAPVNGLELYYERRGSGRPLVLLHGGLLTIDLNFGPLLEPLAAGRQVIAVELQGHGHTADTGRAMTIEALAGDVVALLDHLGITEADLFGFSLGGLVACAVALGAPARAGPAASPARQRTPRPDRVLRRRPQRARDGRHRALRRARRHGRWRSRQRLRARPAGRNPRRADQRETLTASSTTCAGSAESENPGRPRPRS